MARAFTWLARRAADQASLMHHCRWRCTGPISTSAIAIVGLLFWIANPARSSAHSARKALALANSAIRCVCAWRAISFWLLTITTSACRWAAFLCCACLVTHDCLAWHTGAHVSDGLDWLSAVAAAPFCRNRCGTQVNQAMLRTELVRHRPTSAAAPTVWSNEGACTCLCLLLLSLPLPVCAY